MMSLRVGEPEAVYRRVRLVQGPLGSNPASSVTRRDTLAPGWSRRFCPTPGRLCTTGMPNSRRWSSGPTPDSISKCGDATAPPQRTTSSPCTTNFSPPLSTSRPVARRPSKSTRRTWALGLMVRFSRWRLGSRWVSVMLMRTPSVLFFGMRPRPELSGWLMSEVSGNPAATQAA